MLNSIHKSIIICLLFILFVGYLICNFENENYSYPYYPKMYKYKPLLLKGSEYPNYRNLGNGGLLVWNNTPIDPLYINCRKSIGYNNICNYIVGNGPQSVTSP